MTHLKLTGVIPTAAPPFATRPRGAIVLGGDYRGLGIVRSLGRRGIPVWVIKDQHTVAAHSRFAEKVIDWSAGDESDRGRRLKALAHEMPPLEWALFPTTDQMATLVARDFDRLAQAFVLTTPSADILNISQDKRKTHELAARCGVRFPRTLIPSDVGDLSTLDVRFPAIIKPAVKNRNNPLTNDKAWPVRDRKELNRQYQIAARLLPADQIMIQDLIPGDGRFQFSYAGVMDKGRPVAEVVANRLRQYPADFGLHSTYVVSVEDEEVEAAGRGIVAELGYTGLIEIEFKRDPRDLSLNLLDINARVWGWHTMGAHSGVDFVHIYWHLLQGERVDPLRVPAGETWMRFLTDCLTSTREIRRGRFPASKYLASLLRRHEPAILSLKDPLPMVLDAPFLAYLRWRRAFV